ncbi:MAG: methionine--tRNA ligase [Candidatus Marsarchaeota archaeon]|nr:methionine--tRNA ligase [Candidatus Marsarchaeota archaeon]
MADYYITTPIYYVNDKPHIGHAYTTTMADMLARWHRLLGDNVFFLTGTDEHGEKVQKAAEKHGKSPKEFVDSVVPQFIDAWKTFNITNDIFMRTTDLQHDKTVKEFIRRIYDSGDIYKGEYEGWYCVPDETFITELQLKEGRCPYCGRTVNKVKEESYFFRLGKYRQRLLDLYEKHPGFLSPKYRAMETINRVKEGLNDLSITRRTVKWGIEFKQDKDHVVYVWLDALVNYLSALRWPDGTVGRFWPADVHIVGKDIAWFHTVIWPALLMSAGVEPPKMVFSHGWWTVEGKKMGKSLGNAVDPIDIIRKYGVDPLRYYFAREMPFGEDGDFSESKLIARINGELVDDLGNLVYRSLTLAERFGGEIKGTPELDKGLDIERIKALMGNLDTFNAIEAVWERVRCSNRYINEKEAWKLRGEQLGNVIYNLLESIRIISILLSPFMPDTSERIRMQLGVEKQGIDQCRFGEFRGKVKKAGHLFEKVKE